ncbi:hypothetical protein OSTOST_10910, partial [Ostertagia ostertagi]
RRHISKDTDAKKPEKYEIRRSQESDQKNPDAKEGMGETILVSPPTKPVQHIPGIASGMDSGGTHRRPPGPDQELQLKTAESLHENNTVPVTLFHHYCRKRSKARFEKNVVIRSLRHREIQKSIERNGVGEIEEQDAYKTVTLAFQKFTMSL